VKVMIILAISITIFSLLLNLIDTSTGFAVQTKDYIKCYDTDKGDYFTYGKTVYSYKGVSKNYQYTRADVCNGGSELLEWTCDGLVPIARTIKCDCNYGACVATSENTYLDCHGDGILGDPYKKYCSRTCRCSVGEGDCDYDFECLDGLKCDWNQGKKYGFDSRVDICK